MHAWCINRYAVEVDRFSSPFFEDLKPNEQEIDDVRKVSLGTVRREDAITSLVYQKLFKRLPHQPSLETGPLTEEQTVACYEWLISNWGDISTDAPLALFIRKAWHPRIFPVLPSEALSVSVKPSVVELAAESGRPKNPDGKRCRGCDSELHLVKDCPLKPKGAGARKQGDRGARGGAASGFGKEFGAAWRAFRGRF